MIFARKRRPQVSAENHSLRTGEISKLLSREWNSMDPVSVPQVPLHLQADSYLRPRSSFILTRQNSSKILSTQSIQTTSTGADLTIRANGVGQIPRTGGLWTALGLWKQSRTSRRVRTPRRSGVKIASQTISQRWRTRKRPRFLRPH